jgi:hypothetical protein
VLWNRKESTMHRRYTKATLLGAFCTAYWLSLHESGNHRLAWKYAVGTVMDVAADYEMSNSHLQYALETVGSTYGYLREDPYLEYYCL